MILIDLSHVSPAEFNSVIEGFEARGLVLKNVECGGDQVNGYFEGGE